MPLVAGVASEPSALLLLTEIALQLLLVDVEVFFPQFFSELLSGVERGISAPFLLR